MSPPRKTTCKGCRKPLRWAGTGRPPIWCDKCNPRPSNRERATKGQRDRAVPQRHSAKAVRRAGRLAGAAQAAVGADAIAAKMIAIGLRFEPDPVRAARLVGVVAEGPELDALIAEARGEGCRSLREGSPVEMAAFASGVVGLASLTLLRRVHEIPPSMLPKGMRDLIAVRAALGGGAVQYTAINLQIIAPDDAPPDAS